MRAWPVAIALMLAAIGGYLALFPLLRSLEPGSSFARDATTGPNLPGAPVTVQRASPTVVAATVHPGAQFVRALPARRAGTTGGGTGASPAVTTGQATTFVSTSGTGRRATRPAATATPSRTRNPVTGAGEQGSGAGLASSQSSSGAQVTGGSQVTLGPSR
jgi:hypothetical protein